MTELERPIERGDRVWSVAVDGDNNSVNGGVVVDAGLVDGVPFYEALVEDKRQIVAVRSRGGNSEKLHRTARLLRMFVHWSQSPDRRIDPARIEPVSEAGGYVNTHRLEAAARQALLSAAFAPLSELLRLVVAAGELLELRRDLIAVQKERIEDRVDDFNEALEEKRRARAEAQ